ncbi:MAG: hypothetical protein WCF98_12720 [Synechococcus sp. ELA057]
MHALTPGGTIDPHHLSDHALGQRIGSLIASQGAGEFTPAPILGQIQDLLGEDTALLGPLRDLLVRPAFRQLVAAQQRSVLLGGRDALLQDLNATYNPAMVARLTAVIDGCLGLPPGQHPAFSQQADPGSSSPSPSAYSHAAYAPPGYGQQSAYAAAHSAGWSQGYTPAPGSIPPPGPGPYGQPAGHYPPASTGRNGNPLTALLIVLVSLLAGGLMMGLGWLLHSNQGLLSPRSTTARTPAASGANNTTAASTATNKASQTEPSPSTDTATSSSSTSGGAWGDASTYKFGRLPGGDYPNSCAFSQTDSDGKIATDKTSMEYWACRDVGGDPDRGYSVVWADGKQTTYTFAKGGTGNVVGTNGSTYPMRWQNDTHLGSDIIVINHQDGAQSWIPGHIRDSQD